MSDLIFYVYEHWRPDTGVCFYVGKGKNRRAWSMRNRRNKYHLSIQSKLTALGLGVQVRIVVENLSEDTAFRVERERIALYDFSQLANHSKGGEGRSGGSMSAEGRAKVSLAAKGRKLSEEHKAKIGAFFRGRKLTPEHVDKMRVAHKGQRPSDKTLEAARLKNTGSIRSPETIARMVAAKTGVPLSAEWRAAISEGQRGKVISMEQRAKLRAAWKTRPPMTEATRSKLSESVRLSWARRKGRA